MAASEVNVLPKSNILNLIFKSVSIRPAAIALFTLAFAYRGGFWLVVIHQIEGATEANEPPLLLHWLRDSTLMLPLVLVSVSLSLLLARWLVQRLASHRSRLVTSLIIIVLLAFVTSAVVAAASPLHDIIFQASEPAEHNHSGVGSVVSIDHIVYDGLLALAANLVIAGLGMVILDGKVWIEEPGQRNQPDKTVINPP